MVKAGAATRHGVASDTQLRKIASGHQGGVTDWYLDLDTRKTYIVLFTFQPSLHRRALYLEGVRRQDIMQRNTTPAASGTHSDTSIKSVVESLNATLVAWLAPCQPCEVVSRTCLSLGTRCDVTPELSGLHK